MTIDIATLLEPISADEPCGEDVSFDEVLDHIREARRADDPNLSQGEWQTEIKTADWRRVVELCEGILNHRSKDLQVAVWLAEASIARDGLAGAGPAFALLEGLVGTHWNDLYPRVEDDDLEERAARFAWLNTYATQALQRAPLSDGKPAMTLLDWQISREVDNLARQNAEAHQEALDEGKPSGEIFDKTIDDSTDAFVRDSLAQVQAAQADFERMSASVDERLGRAAPSLADIRDALKRIRRVLERSAQARGLIDEDADVAGPSAGESTASVSAAGQPAPASKETDSKEAALRSLTEIAAYFKRTEPHSPVSFLLARAVAWANMPLDQWLVEVVHDDATLTSIRDRLGIPPG